MFRPPPLTVLFALLLAVCAVPFAFGAPWFWLIFLVPIAIVGYVCWVRTDVDEEALTVRQPWGRTRRVPWSSVGALRLRKGRRVSAVLVDGGEVPLPAVRVRDLPRLAAVSGGRLPDPTGPTGNED